MGGGGDLPSSRLGCDRNGRPLTFLPTISQPDALNTKAYRPITMASRGVSTLKFVGTVSLGLLTVSPSYCQFAILIGRPGGSTSPHLGC